VARKRPKLELTSAPGARTGDLAGLFTNEEDSEHASGMQLVALRLDAIEADPTQPRTLYDEDSLADLAASIRQVGVIQPIEVVQIDRDRYRLVHGERRWRASRLAGIETIPAVVRRRDYDDITRFVRQLVENIQREDLNDIDRAAGLARLRDLLQDELNAEAENRGERPWNSRATWAKVAERLGYSRQRVSQLTRLLELPEELQRSVRDGLLSERDTRIFHGLNRRQQRALHRVRVEEGTVTQAEAQRVATWIKQGHADSVALAIKTVQSGQDRVEPDAETEQYEQVQRMLRNLERAVAALESADISLPDPFAVQLATLNNRITALLAPYRE
jgi:ParB family chromosome partitioning protein